MVLRQRTISECGLNFRDARSFFRYSNQRLRGPEPIPALQADGAPANVCPSDKADVLASHFAQIYSTPDLSKPCNIPQYTTARIISPDSAIVFTEELVSEQLARLSSKNSTTPDKIPPTFLKTFRLFLSEPLTYIFQRSYEEAIAPALFRSGIVTALHKKGSKHDVCNYRPITQGVIACQIFERMLTSHIVHHLKMNNLFDPNQHGFVPLKSTTTQLLDTVHEYANFINERVPFHAVYFDLKSAFDKVDHRRLLAKMGQLGLHHKTIQWCSSYLTDRSFRVKVLDYLSIPHPVSSGVPQGGSLSPLLYVIYVLDIGQYIPHSIKYLSFADDLKLMGPARNSTDVEILQQAILGVGRWCEDNNMVLSIPKCNILINQSLAAHSQPNYTINGTKLPIVHRTRDLGVDIAADLDFDGHITALVSSARILVNSIFRCFIVRRPEFYIRLFQTLVLPKFLYCAPIWLPYKAKHRRSIESINEYFCRRLSLRCPGVSHPSEIPSIIEAMESQDERALRRIILIGNTHRFFKLRRNSLRSSVSISTNRRARLESIRHQFAWRICSKVTNGVISKDILNLASIVAPSL